MIESVASETFDNSMAAYGLVWPPKIYVVFIQFFFIIFHIFQILNFEFHDFILLLEFIIVTKKKIHIRLSICK